MVVEVVEGPLGTSLATAEAVHKHVDTDWMD